MSQLTDQERAVLDLLTKAWNAFVKLPIERPSDGREFEHHTHILQRQIMARPVRRSLREEARTK